MCIFLDLAKWFNKSLQRLRHFLKHQSRFLVLAHALKSLPENRAANFGRCFLNEARSPYKNLFFPGLGNFSWFTLPPYIYASIPVQTLNIAGKDLLVNRHIVWHVKSERWWDIVYSTIWWLPVWNWRKVCPGDIEQIMIGSRERRIRYFMKCRNQSCNR